jgi:hypothetical protein
LTLDRGHVSVLTENEMPSKKEIRRNLDD